MKQQPTQLAVALLEQEGVARSFSAAPQGHSLVWNADFSDAKSFENGLRVCMSKLFVSPEEVKVLVISAHGDEATGCLLTGDEDNSEQVHLDQFASYFKPAPQNLIILVRACFGGYPEMRALQGDLDNTPIVVGPLVEIEAFHASEFQKRLLTGLGQGVSPQDAVRDVVDKFNKSDGHSTKYGELVLFGMCDKARAFHPVNAEGQLRGAVEPYETFQILDLLPPGPPEKAVHVRLKGSDGRGYLANAGPVVYFRSRYPDAEWISARYQIMQKERAPATLLLGGLDIVLLRVRRAS